MNNVFPFIVIAFAIIPFVITLLLLFIFLFNKKKYEELLSMHNDKGFVLNAPYNFYSWMGFFGSFGMAYYFSTLKKGVMPLIDRKP